MKRTSRILSAALAILMAASLVLASCGTPESTTADTKATPTTTNARTILETKTPEGTNFGGEKIKFLSRSDVDYYDEITVKPEEVVNVIDESILQRESTIEDKLGVEIDNEKIAAGTNYALITDTIREHFRSNLDTYQLIANGCYHTMDASLEGCFWSLSDIDGIDLSMPWYSQYFVEEAALPSGELYFVAGDATISRIRWCYATFFNQTLAETYGTGDLYKVVEEGKWTIDYQHGIVANVYSDENGNNTTDEGDLFGFAAHYVVGVDPYWSAFQLPIVRKSDGKFVDAIDGERMVDGLTKIIDLFYNSNGSYIYWPDSSDPNNEYMTREFASDHYLFMTHWLLAVETEYMTDMESAYGIIPIPKLNEDQDDYYSYTHDLMSVVGIPGTVPEEDLEMLGIVIEELSAYSYNYTREAYYELALKGRYMRDQQSRDMLDLIVNNLRIDAGWIYSKSLNGIALTIRTLVREKNTGWAKVYRSQTKILQYGIDKLNGDR